MTIEFIGIRAGHGTTTVALATAAILAQHRPCRIAAHNPADLCAPSLVSPLRRRHPSLSTTSTSSTSANQPT